MTQFMLLNDLRFFCRKAASFNAWLQQLRITQPDELDAGQWGV